LFSPIATEERPLDSLSAPTVKDFSPKELFAAPIAAA